VDTPAGPVPTLLPPGSRDDGDPRLDAVPALGQHTDAILAELGLDAADRRAARGRGHLTHLAPHTRTPTMASTIIDSRIFQGIFSSDAMRQVWSDENRTARYIDVERAWPWCRRGWG
jgi:hypothetical protein